MTASKPGGWRRLAAPVLTQWPFASVLVVLLVAVLYLLVEPAHWLRAAALISLACLLAAVLRFRLKPDRAGMLVVRGGLFDLVAYVGLAVLIIVVGLLLPS